METNRQSSQWKLPHKPRPKKPTKWHHGFVLQRKTDNKNYYLHILCNWSETIHQKCPIKGKIWLFHHDKAASAHTPLLERNFLAKNNTLMTSQPLHSPDLAPFDYYVFLKLKGPMRGRRYATIDEIKTKMNKITKMIFLKWFEDWKKH